MQCNKVQSSFLLHGSGSPEPPFTHFQRQSDWYSFRSDITSDALTLVLHYFVRSDRALAVYRKCQHAILAPASFIPRLVSTGFRSFSSAYICETQLSPVFRDTERKSFQFPVRFFDCLDFVWRNELRFLCFS